VNSITGFHDSMKLKFHGSSFFVASSQGCRSHVTRKFGMSDEDANRMLATCLQQIMHVMLVNFGERHDTWTNGQHYTAADCHPTNQVSAWKAKQRNHPRHAILTRMLRVSGALECTRMLQRNCSHGIPALQWTRVSAPLCSTLFPFVMVLHCLL